MMEKVFIREVMMKILITHVLGVQIKKKREKVKIGEGKVKLL